VLLRSTPEISLGNQRQRQGKTIYIGRLQGKHGSIFSTRHAGSGIQRT
jgi:hypothetical protein